MFRNMFWSSSVLCVDGFPSHDRQAICFMKALESADVKMIDNGFLFCFSCRFYMGYRLV